MHFVLYHKNIGAANSFRLQNLSHV